MKTILNTVLLLFSLTAMAQTQLAIPDTLTGTSITLTMHKDSVQFFSVGKISQTFGFNQYKYLGPTLILNKGNTTNITVNNQIGDTTTVHWHGMHVAPTNDGNPHNAILPSASWNPSFTVMDNAATYWYHPHFHGKTAKQAIKGAAGLIIVRDLHEATLNLPRTYGVDDFPVVLQCQQYDNANQAMPLGMQDSTLLVNGARANYGDEVFGNFPAQMVRMRLLNASGERSFKLGFTGNKQFYQLATDGGLLNSPVTLTRLMLSPGERAEILVDLTTMNGQTIYLMSYGAEIPSGVQGGPTMVMGAGNPPMDSPLNGVNYNILKINVVAPTANAIVTIPTVLDTVVPYTASQANITRKITMTAQSMMSMDGPFYFNNNLFDMVRVDYKVPLNNTEIWELTNLTMVAHPFHIHDVQFYILDRDGNVPALEERGRKDVVLVSPNETVRFITKFEDFADSLNPYMYHCHILMHEDDGMMGQFVVIPSTLNNITTIHATNSLQLYPNPATNAVTVNLEENSSIKIYNTLGEIMYSTISVNDTTILINTSNLSKGMYTVQVSTNDKMTTKKLVIN
ncbi:MAG: multicopper oxidase domain-containing protein [Bacteroidia bacterium]|nr:multicopper oxidase domain-containing protein [Bacteroidia bacterium]